MLSFLGGPREFEPFWPRERSLKVMLLDGDWPQTPYLIAELKALGAEVVLVSPLPPDPGGLLQYCTQIRSPAVEKAAEYEPFLLDLLRREQADLILPLCEPVQQIFWTHNEATSARVFPETTAWQRDILMDRRKLYALAESVQIPVPVMEDIAGEEDLPRVIGVLGFPLVLRGTQGLAGEQVRIVRSLEDARSAYRALRETSPGAPFAQGFLDGPRSLIGAVMDHGRIIQHFSQRTLEAVPPPTGPSVRVQSLADPVLKSYAERLFGALGWDGAACAEFIQLGPGNFRLLEVNPRPWAAIRASHVCGVPLVTLFARYLMGQPVSGGKSFPDGQDCTLFPHFITSRIRWGQFPRLRDARAYAQMMKAVPWNHPALVRHFLKIIWWTMHAPRLDRPAPPDRPSTN